MDIPNSKYSTQCFFFFSYKEIHKPGGKNQTMDFTNMVTLPDSTRALAKIRTNIDGLTTGNSLKLTNFSPGGFGSIIGQNLADRCHKN